MTALRKTIAATLLILAPALFAPGTAPCADPASEGKAAATAANAFAIDMYKAIGKKDGNLIFSPYSVSTALAMAYAGARGRTAFQMAKVLHLQGEQDKVPEQYRALNESILSAAKGGSVQINIANALWVERSFPIRKEYLETVRVDYRGRMGQEDFLHNHEAARSAINKWVERETKDKIKNLLPGGAITELTRLVLTNAIYSKGLWKNQFEKKLTRQAPFHCLDGRETSVHMMHQVRCFGYAEEAGLKVLEMPYKGRALSMVVFLPSKERRFVDFEQTVTSDTLRKWFGKLENQEVKVYFPRYKATSELRLETQLTELGMTDAFEPKTADFSGMTGNKELFIDKVILKAFVEVNEEGSEGAAATAVVERDLVLSPPPRMFRADHPFVFLIRHKPTNCILFLGRVTNPQREAER